MQLSDIVALDRIVVDSDGGFVHTKTDALRLLAAKLAPAVHASREMLEAELSAREQLQSTGIGDGVAIPHTSIEGAEGQAAALLLCPQGVPFDAIDGERCTIILGVVGPKRQTGLHLRTLARISRLLRDADTRDRLVHADSPEAALQLIVDRDGGG